MSGTPRVRFFIAAHKTSPSLLAMLKSFPLLIKERDVRNSQGEVLLRYPQPQEDVALLRLYILIT
jgi:hypothetical protein